MAMSVEAWGAVVVAALAILGFIGNIVYLTNSFTRGLGQMEMALRETLKKDRESLETQLDVSKREIGETTASMRQQLHNNELYQRDTFVRNDVFFNLVKRIEDKADQNWLRMEARLERIEEKLTSRPFVPTQI